MYRTKKDVDKHVENLISKLSVKEFKTRAYSIARLYFEVGDYASCQKYVEQYLTQKDSNAAAHKLLGQALQKLGEKEKALEQYKTSLDIDPTQSNTVLEICELLADDEVAINPGRAKYWCEKAEALFPRHPVTFRLRERLVSVSNPDPEALVKLLTAELGVRPKDASLHCRLLRHYLHTNQIKQAFEHACNIEFGNKMNFFNNIYGWYETLAEILRHNSHKPDEWQYQLLLLTVRERLCVLSLSETPSGYSKSLIESNELLHAYDQAMQLVAEAGIPSGFGEFHSALLKHHRGQFVFHAATYLLKKAKKDQLSWRDATQSAAPLILIAWQTVPLDSKVNWLTHAPEKQQIAVNRWYIEGTFRCSQAGHYLLANIQDRNQSFLDKISQFCSGHWKDKLYGKIFSGKDHLAKIKTSHFVTDAYETPVLRLPRRIEVEACDVDAQREYPTSLHHFVWTLLNYKNFAHFKCTLFDMLTPTASNCGPETLNKLDIHAFLFCAALTKRQQKPSDMTYASSDKPTVIPANITDLLCPLPQMKWWDCAYKFSQNELGTELTDVRATLSRGIEVVRRVDNHGLDPELLCILGSIFSEKAKLTTSVDEKNNLEIRAGLYYASAIPMLEKLKNKMSIKIPEKRLFDYTHKELGLKELNLLIEESKMYVALNHLNDGDYEKVIDLLASLKSPQAYYHLGQTYRKMAMEEKNLSRDVNSIETKSKYASLMIKAKNYAYKALDRVKEIEINKYHPLYSDIQMLIEDVETNINRIDPEFSMNNDNDGKYSSDENISSGGSENVQTRNNNFQIYRNISSTPKQASNSNLTHYRTAIDSQILEPPKPDLQFFEKIESQIKNFQMRLADDIMEQTKSWFEENRRLGNQIMSTLQSDIQNTTDQFRVLKISVDHIKDQISECRNECKDVGELKKQIAELKKEVSKLKKATSEQTIDESDLYNLDDDYRTCESTSTFAAPVPPFQNPQVMPPFNQRLVPPFPVPSNPYQLYNQSLYNFYNQYSQFGQTSGAPPLFDPARTPNYTVNYPGVYPNPDQMYLDVAHIVPPAVSAVPTISSVPPAPATVTPPVSTAAKPKPNTGAQPKEIPKSLPVNVVITSSDPLPTCTTAPAPVLSVTIPPKHIKASTPHNYQIPMPSSNQMNMSPPVFSFSSAGNKPVSTPSTLITWGQPPSFTSAQASTGTPENNLFHDSKNNTLDKSDVNGSFTAISPNTSLNKSRTLSERSNTSIENYDPCPDFKPIIPLPAEVKVTTGEEDETIIFNSRAKLYRYVDKQWKERGIGELKLLKHRVTGHVRVLMRREQIHKICANHNITPDIDIKPMPNENKAYFWAANDFADETIVFEKFCARFKTAEIAQQFRDTFEKSRLELKNSQGHTPEIPASADQKVVKTDSRNNDSQSTKPVGTACSTTQQSKTEFGGFTFNNMPAFKTAEDNKKTEAKISEPVTPKLNVFSTLNLIKPTSTSSPFSAIFSSTASPVTTTAGVISKQETPNNLNSSDTVEEFEPNVEFKPVVPLPALIDPKTGEENEDVLFEHRAKLLRYDAVSKEWKERGLGNIKILANKENPQKVRLLMRREQIMKVCCNHSVTKDMIFHKMPNKDQAVTWCAKDFSEGELVAETFCLRFKTVQICDDFMAALKTAQSKIKDEPKEEQDTAKQTTQIGFGDKFKPLAGSWYCDKCYTNNLESFTKCDCCEQPKTENGTKEPNPSKPTAVITASSGWGDKFKPKPGSWECTACFVRNEGNDNYCTACNGPKDPNMPKKEPCAVAPVDLCNKFKFGLPSQPVNSISSHTSVPSVTITSGAKSGFGDKFKPKEGSWECKQCFVRNEGNFDKCCACNSPKDEKVSGDKSATSVLGPDFTMSGPQFKFGIPPTKNTNVDLKPKTETTSIFDGTGTHKFSFGINANTQDQKPLIFGKESALNLTSKANNENEPVTPVKTALLPTLQTDNTAFGVKNAGTFEFKFVPKTPPKGKSPLKSPKTPGEESDDNEYASEDEGHHIHFSPVIPLPDKVEVVTGEENETELYGHRAKLYRHTNGEWKERGIGIVKILKHKETGKLRIVMRREQVLKICLNHALTPDITYTPKDDKTWLFATHDFSENELTVEKFCLRFKNKEIAIEFKEAVDNARSGKLVAKKETATAKDSDSDDVVFVDEIQATAEEKERAKELMLPENFFTYKNKAPCKGCRGCTDDDDTEQPKPYLKIAPSALPAYLSTPNKSSISAFQSPMNSFYGTPANFDKTLDSSVFRTPLGSIGSNTKSDSPTTPFSDTSDNDSKNKENAFTQKSVFGSSNIFGSTTQTALGDKPSLFGQSQNLSSNIFGSPSVTATGGNKGILAVPKLNPSSAEKKTEESKSSFGLSQANQESISTFGTTQNNLGTKTIFGASQTSQASKSIFSAPQSNHETKSLFGGGPVFGSNSSGFSTNTSIFSVTDSGKDDSKGPEVKSIFAGDSKPVNLFSGANQGTIFGPGALSDNQQKPSSGLFGASGGSIFKTNTTQPQGFGKSIFGSAASGRTRTWNLGTKREDQKSDLTHSAEKKTEERTAEDPALAEPLLKVDNNLTFAALSSSAPGIALQKKPDFQWEGAGQQLFTAAQKASTDAAKSGAEGGAGDDSAAGAEEEYDPHYEPIVPLPDEIVVTTGEEDEEKLFGERSKLYRFDGEWKERGVGEMKILYHPQRQTYRLLLRREQVHKAVLNMLLHTNFELRPMKNSECSWMWAGINFAENPSGEQETLSARFKNVQLANAFKNKVMECVEKLQVAAVQATSKTPEKPIEPLRLPKGLEDSARADPSSSTNVVVSPPQATPFGNMQNGQANVTEPFKQVQFQEPDDRNEDEPDDEDGYDNEYNDDYEYYNEDEDDDESPTYYACDGEALIRQGESDTTCENAHIQVVFDQEVYSPKILITDNDTGEILADMLIHTETQFDLDDTSCTWTGMNFTSNDPVDKTVTVNFHDLQTARMFHDSCETSKAATYSSTDPES